MSEFEFYEGTASEAQGPRITVRRSGQLVLTPAAVELLGEDVRFVQIGFSRKTRAVGLRPVLEGGRGRYRLRTQKNSPLCLVDGKRFFAHQGLKMEKSQRFEAEEFGGGIVGFRLPAEAGEGEESPKPTKKATARRKPRAA